MPDPSATDRMIEVLRAVRTSLDAADKLREKYDRLIRAAEAVRPYPITTADRITHPATPKGVDHG